MTENFYLYLLALVFGFIVSILIIYWVGLVNSRKKLIEESRKLQLLINRARADYTDLRRNPQDLIGQIASGVGIDGILEALGVDPGILSSPMVRGLIQKFAPKVLEQLNKKPGKEQESNTDGYLF